MSLAITCLVCFLLGFVIAIVEDRIKRGRKLQHRGERRRAWLKNKTQRSLQRDAIKRP